MNSVTSASARPKRNAQNLLSIYQSARSSGVRMHPASLDELITAMTAGVTVDDCASPFYGKRFCSGTFSDQARADMLKYLHYETRTGELDYVLPFK